MQLTRTDRDHQFGHITTYTNEAGDLLTLDRYEDQYSLTWSTNISPITFVFAWSLTADASDRMLLHTADSKQPIQGSAGRLFEMVRIADRDGADARIGLMRLWRSDVSVTWQLLPLPERGMRPVVGVASNHIDPIPTLSYFRATASDGFRGAGEYIPGLLSDVPLKRGFLKSLDATASILETRRRYE